MTGFSEGPATRSVGLERLSAFLPHAGNDYTQWRNYDLGNAIDNRVSGLSPWLRHRLITEAEVIHSVIDTQGIEPAEKFIQEVLWRTYWKGFLERRPSLWHDYRARVRDAQAMVDKDRALYQRYRQATAGETGIECFDHWVNCLVETGYLHNHARMWFSSIWVFTLGLPWALGADFFLRYLLDGDAASNTLSWRWVAGYQTADKTYRARASNIAEYTQGRFNPEGQLSNEAPAPVAEPRPALGPVPEPVAIELTPNTGLLITDDDLYPEGLFGMPSWPAVASLQTTAWRGDQPSGERVQAFAEQALQDASNRNPAAGSAPSHRVDANDNASIDALIRALKDAGVNHLVSAWVPTGPGADAMNVLAPRLKAAGIAWQPVPRDWDLRYWPFATHGFFRFWKGAAPLIGATPKR